MDKREMVQVAFQLGFIIALPVIFFGFLGKWADHRFGTYPVITLVGILIAIGLTSIWIYQKFKSFFNK